MQRGEWWIDDSGQLTFADGDVGDTNHEMIAFYAALGLLLIYGGVGIVRAICSCGCCQPCSTVTSGPSVFRWQLS